MRFPLIAIVAGISCLIPPAAGITRIKSFDRPMKIFFVYCVVSLFQVIVEYLLAMHGINNTFLSNISFPVECFFLSVVYWLSTGDRRVRRAIVWLAILYSVVWVVGKVHFETPGQLNSFIMAVSRIFVIAISVILIQNLLKDTVTFIADRPVFWVSSGSILYSAGVLVVLGVSNELIKGGRTFFNSAWYINWSLFIIGNLMFAKAFLCRVTRQTLSG